MTALAVMLLAGSEVPNWIVGGEVSDSALYGLLAPEWQAARPR